MKISIADISEVRKSIQVTFEPDLLAQEEKKVMQFFSKNAVIKGFRKGKVPADAIRVQYGAEIAERLSKQCIDLALDHIEKEPNLKLYALIEVKGHIEGVQAAQTLTFTVDIIPPFELPNYKGIPVKAEEVIVEDSQVEQFINDLRKNFSNFKPVERPAQKGDYVQISYKALSEEGHPISPMEGVPSFYFGQENTWEEVQAQEGLPSIPAISVGVLGMSMNEVKTVIQVFPSDFKVASLAGLSFHYQVTVQAIQEAQIAPLDDTFFQKIKVKNVEELNAIVRSKLENDKKQESHTQKRAQIIEFLDKNTDFIVPESAQDAEAKNLLDNYLERQMSLGVSQKKIKENEDTLLQSSQAAGALRAKTIFILSRIAEAEKITPSPEDMHKALVGESMALRMQPEVYVKNLRKDQAKLNTFRRNVLIDKTLEFLIENSSISCQDSESNPPPK